MDCDCTTGTVCDWHRGIIAVEPPALTTRSPLEIVEVLAIKTLRHIPEAAAGQVYILLAELRASLAERGIR